jgi:serine/threonine protein phosphatase PrpC
MEDAHHTHPELCVVSLSSGQSNEDTVQDDSRRHLTTSMQPSHSGLGAADSTQSLHFFGLYDGHAGNTASQQGARRLHYHLCRALVDSCNASGSCILDDLELDSHGSNHSPSGEQAVSSESYGQGSPTCSEMLHPSCSQVAFPEGSAMADWLARHPHGHSHRHDQQQHHGSSHSSSTQPEPGTCKLEAALHSAFLSMDHELSLAGNQMALMGSTAVVALVGRTHIWVANAGERHHTLAGCKDWGM